MRIDELAPAPGSTKRKKRVGRGIGGRGGKTAGAGTKGQHSRGRGKVNRGFEGGQMPLKQRVPKLKGFNNPFRVEYYAVNLDALEELGESEVNPEILVKKGVAHKGTLVKVLGRGKITKAVKVSAHAVSKSAEQAIVAAGGSVTLLPLPHKIRPAAKGNQFTNR
ncbi:MAG: ribosomal protein [Actinomycetota bacterium]|jgi:large subunit ribosomal protein L15|nr:50S ribosomal protein L15 [Actinomycetota bacterium]